MKRSLFNLVCLSLVLTFSVACGKKSSGGGGGTNYASNPLINNGQGTVVGTTGHSELVNWLNTADVASGMRAYYGSKSGSMNFWSEVGACTSTATINMPGCTELKSCFVSNNLGAVGLGTTVLDGKRPKNCTLSGAFYNKASDTALREAVLGKSGRVVLKDRTLKSGSIYTVYYALYEGSTQLSGAARINTSLPAVISLEIIEEGSQRSKTYFQAY